MTSGARLRVADKVARLASEATDLVPFWRSVTEVVRPVLPHWWAPCFFTVDPASLLVTSHFHEGLDEFPREALVAEYEGEDVHQLRDVIRSASGLSTLHEATNGDPSSSARWQFNMTLGGDQELIARLRTPRGVTWGAVSFYREPGAPMFDDADKAFVRLLTPEVARGARTALLVGEATAPEGPQSPGLAILDRHGAIQSTTSGVREWFADLPGGDAEADRLPPAVLAVAAAALRSAPATPDGAFARVLAGSGQWVVLHGARLDADGEPRVAVIVEPAHPARIVPLLIAAYAMTERESDVTRLVLQASSTAEIANALNITPATVQEHLKRVFAKVGVRSRRELVARIFFTHYEPRVRDNEMRTRMAQPLRGGPMNPGTRGH